MNEPILRPIYTREDARGIFQEIIRGSPWLTIIVGQMNTGSQIGQHYHLETLLFFYVMSGAVIVTIENVETSERFHVNLKKKEGILLKPMHAHVIRFIEKTDYLLLKSNSYDPENPDTFPYEMIAE